MSFFTLRLYFVRLFLFDQLIKRCSVVPYLCFPTLHTITYVLPERLFVRTYVTVSLLLLLCRSGRDMSELPMHTFKAKAPYTGTVESVEKLVKPGASGEVIMYW